MTGSRVLRHRGGAWEGVTPEAYRPTTEAPEQVVRHTLLGSAGDAGLAFETRYFELAPGASTSLERHAHAHAVVVLRGRGQVILGDATAPLEPFDAVYVAPWELHQFRAAGDREFGFLCVVDRHRHDLERPEGSSS